MAGLKRFDEARISYEESLRLNPDQAEAANDLARLLATCPEESLRNPQRARELAEKAVQLVPEDVEFQGTLGVAYYRSGDFENAVTALRKLVEDGRVTEDSFFLAMAEWKIGNHEEAREVLSTTVEWLESQSSTSEERDRLRAEAESVIGHPSHEASAPFADSMP